MKQINFKQLLPHIIAIVVFLLVSIIYCKPTLEGKTLNQHDTQGWKGMAQQSFEVKEKTGKFPLWTNSMFGGMPTFQIAMEGTNNVGVAITYFDKAFKLFLPDPISFFFLASLCFYLLCIVLGINPWVSILGGLAYAYSTYNPIIVSVGHNTKMMSLAYAPMVIAGLQLLFQKKYLVGFIITALFSTLLIAQNHLQIVYYMFIVAGTMVVANIIYQFKQNNISCALKASCFGLIAGLVGLGVCAATILPTYDYAKETMRGGKSQLTLNKEDSVTNNKTKGGLDKDYALRWSLGKMETFTFLVPGLYGGSNGGNEHSSSAKMVEKFGEIGVPEEQAMGAVNGYSYWGSMSSLSETTSGPVYLGAVICFLFIIGLFYENSWQKWWIIAASLIGIVLAWGSNFMAFNSFMLDYLPFYSKFRAPSMALTIPQFCIPLLAVLTLNKLVKETNLDNVFNKIKNGAIATIGVFVILAAFWFMADYTGKGDKDIKQNFTESFSRSATGQQPNAQAIAQAEEASKDIMTALREDRKNEAGGDIFRSLTFVLLTGLIIGLLLKKKLNPLAAIILIMVLSFFDMLFVNKRYFSYDKFVEKDQVENTFTPSAADNQILRDPDHANFRVFNQTSNYTNESLTSYHHNSIGGYSPAKLGLYQDLIENQISKGNMSVLNMLNTKYFIGQDERGNQIAQVNPNAYGTCWFVKGVKYVTSANAEMLALNDTNLKDTAVVNESFKTIAQQPQYDSTATIKITERQNDKIVYATNATTPQFAVLSEIYYNRGWNAYIDGKQADYAKVNYALRGIQVPIGKHSIEFKFEPKAYFLGNTISTLCTILLYLAIIAALVLWYVKKDKAA